MIVCIHYHLPDIAQKRYNYTGYDDIFVGLELRRG
jgi:hypothetical protein